MKKNMRFDIVGRIAGSRSFSQWVFVPILLTLTAGTLIRELQADSPFFAQWTSIALTSLVAAWAFVTGIGLLVNVMFPKETVLRFISVLLVFFATEAARAVLVLLMAQAIGLDPDPKWPYQIVAGGMTGWALFGLSAYLVNDAEEYRTTLGQLTQTQATLADLVSATQSDLEIRRVLLLESVRSAITDSIRSVLSSGGSSAREVADDLLRVSEDVVRPLGHSLIPEPEAKPDTSVLPTTRISLRAVLNYATYVQPFRPVAVTLVTVLLVAGVMIFVWPIEVLPWFIALLGWVFGYLSLMGWAFNLRLKSMRVAWRVVTLTVLYLGFAIVPGLFVMFATNTFKPEGLPDFFYILVISQIVLWPLATIAGVREAREDVLEETRKSNTRLAWARARLAQSLWSHQNMVAVALHKDVQGTLMAAAMRLKISFDAGKDDAESIDDIRATVLEAAEFVTTPLEAPPIRTTITELNQRWAGVFEVVFDLDDETSRIVSRVDADSLARRIATDLLSEFVTNAVKHGGATSARVTLSNVSDDVVRLGATNDGRPMSENPVLGLGARMMIAVTVNRGFENVAGGVRMWADIPVV